MLFVLTKLLFNWIKQNLNYEESKRIKFQFIIKEIASIIVVAWQSIALAQYVINLLKAIIINI